jgi:hypothetical protein
LLVAFSKELELAPETQWLACFMQDEISYLIQKVEMATYYFSSIEHLVNRTSAWLWMIMRAFKAMPHAPYMPPRTPKACRVRGCRRPQQTHLATAKITKVKAGNPTSQDNHGSSVDMEQSGKSYAPDT